MVPRLPIRRLAAILAATLLVLAAQATAAHAETEPNDTMATATPITPNATLPGIYEPGDVDWYRFSAAANRTFVAEIVDDNRTGEYLFPQPVDANGDELAVVESGGRYRAQFDTDTAGTYYLRVDGSFQESGNYRIRVVPRWDQGLVRDVDGEPDNVAALAEPLTVGLSGALDRNLSFWVPQFGGTLGDHDVFRFTATAGRRYHATVAPLTDLFVELSESDWLEFTVRSAAGATVGTSDTCRLKGQVCTLDFTAAESGTYYLEVVSAFGYGSGQYRITVELPPTDPGAFRPQPPARVLDTRTGVGAAKAAVPAGGEIAVRVADLVGGRPAASAVALNVTATAATRGGYLTVYPNGSSRPTASNLNFTAAQTRGNLVLARVGPDGRVRIYNGSSGTVQVVADRTGSFLPGTPDRPGAYAPLQPARVLDTRTPGQRPVTGVVTTQVAGRGGVPADGVSAVVLNVTATRATRDGQLTVHPAGQPQTTAYNMYFVAGASVANLVTVPLGPTGEVSIVNSNGGRVDVIADVAGYYLGGTPTRSGMFVPITPTRILDTRDVASQGLAAQSTGKLHVDGTHGIPAKSVAAVVMTVTAIEPRRSGYLTLYPSGTSRPVASSVNFAQYQTVSNLVCTQVGVGRDVSVFNGSAGATHVIVDAAGYYLADDG